MSTQTDAVPDEAGPDPWGPAGVPAGLAEQLVAQAKASGIALTGPGGLLTGLTKQVLETASHASWMNLVECWFSIAERQSIHRGTYTSVKDLNAKIRAFINGWNDRCHPFTWTKTADQILAKANRPTTSNSGH
jgi:hypothetical protein